MKTMTEIVLKLRKAQRKCLSEINEIQTNYNCGFISANEYLNQTNAVTCEYFTIFAGDDDVTEKDFSDAVTIMNFMSVNGLQLEAERE